jgi:hypothetical protein
MRREREREREQNTHTHHKERREEEAREANLSRFGCSEPVFFKPVIGGSNVVGLEQSSFGR